MKKTGQAQAVRCDNAESAMKTWKCPNGHGGQTSVAHPNCPVCGAQMVRADK